MFLRVGATGAAAVGLYAAGSALRPNLTSRGLLSADGVFGAGSIAIADSVYTEVWPQRALLRAVHSAGCADAPTAPRAVQGHPAAPAGAAPAFRRQLERPPAGSRYRPA